MNKKIIFISKEFYPASNGTIACVENILPYLGAEYFVEFFCTDLTGNALQNEYKFDVSIHRACHKSDRIILKKQAELSSLKKQLVHNRIKSFIHLGIIIKYFWVQRVADKLGYVQPNAFEKNIIRFIEKQTDVSKADYVMAVGAPFENIRAAVTLKKKYPEIKLVLLLFDLYTYNPVYLLEDKSLEDMKLRMREEQLWVDCADIIISASETMEQWKKSDFRSTENKLFFLNIPSFRMRDDFLLPNDESKKDTTIDCVYCGTLYEDIRNPRFMLEIFEKLVSLHSDIRLHILGTGCEEILYEFQKRMGERLQVYGQRDRLYSQKILEQADFLLSIGNRTATQLPSKVFEYIATGKPIIHIYSIDEDTCLKYLDRYPLAYCVKEDFSKTEEETEQILNFINRSFALRCDKVELAEKYAESTPKYYAEILMKLMEENNRLIVKGDKNERLYV